MFREWGEEVMAERSGVTRDKEKNLVLGRIKGNSKTDSIYKTWSICRLVKNGVVKPFVSFEVIKFWMRG